jgi:hypothetical protein
MIRQKHKLRFFSTTHEPFFAMRFAVLQTSLYFLIYFAIGLKLALQFLYDQTFYDGVVLTRLVPTSNRNKPLPITA